MGAVSCLGRDQQWVFCSMGEFRVELTVLFVFCCVLPPSLFSFFFPEVELSNIAVLFLLHRTHSLFANYGLYGQYEWTIY